MRLIVSNYSSTYSTMIISTISGSIDSMHLWYHQSGKIMKSFACGPCGTVVIVAEAAGFRCLRVFSSSFFEEPFLTLQNL